MPAEVMGLVAMNELVIHGWDVARTIGATFELPDEVVAAVLPLAVAVPGDPIELLRCSFPSPSTT